MTNYDKLLEKVRNLGMEYRWAKMFVKKLSDDEKAFPVSKEEAEFALAESLTNNENLKNDIAGLNQQIEELNEKCED